MNITAYQQNPMINYTKFGLKQQKLQKLYRFEIPKLSIVQKLPKNHEIIHENEKNNAERRVI